MQTTVGLNYFLLSSQDAPAGSFQTGTQKNGPASYCPQPRPFPPNAEKVIDDTLANECLPSYLRNSNAVLDDDDGTTVWAGGRKPDYSVINELFNRGKKIFLADRFTFSYSNTSAFSF